MNDISVTAAGSSTPGSGDIADSNGRANILVVDDEHSICLLLERLLVQEGFDVRTAANVGGALECLETQSVDLVLSDRNLPDGTGLDIAKAISAELRAGRCEMLLMSAHLTVNVALEAMRLGVGDYVAKPLADLDTVLHRVRQALARLRTRREQERTIEKLKVENKALTAIAMRDPLTGLFNHAYFNENLEREVARSARTKRAVTLMFVDLDRFKEVNDTLGHPVGDRVIKLLADTMRGASELSHSDFRPRTQDIVARFGGDEFAIIMPDTDRAGGALKGERLRQAVSALPFDELGVPPTTISIGIAAYPDDADSHTSLVAAADAALYGAKAAGRNCLISYSKDIDQELQGQVRNFKTTTANREALETCIRESSFDFAYQPMLDVRSGNVFGYEALCRPKDSVFESPMLLLEAAERVGRVIDLGRVLRPQAAAPVDSLPKHALLFVNVHQHELNDPTIGDANSPLTPIANRLVLEMASIGQLGQLGQLWRVRERVQHLRELGFRIGLSLDNAEYGNLQTLVNIEPDFVKLPSRCLDDIAVNSRTARMVNHIVALAAEENIKLVVQQIETAEQAQRATALGLHLQQGTYHGAPGAISSLQN